MSQATQHYKIHKPEPLELIQRYNLNFIEGNIVKYVLRSPFKGDRVGDLKKALEYAFIIDISQIQVRFSQFDFDKELQEYKELSLIEKTIASLVINGLKGSSDKEVLIDYLKMAIGDRKETNQKINFRRHPLCTLIDLIEMIPMRFLNYLEEIEHELDVKIDSENYQFSLILALRDMIEGDEDFLVLLDKIGYGDKEFWENRYDLFWEKAKYL